jgi:tetratricopeptide (TPR) repeat protein
LLLKHTNKALDIGLRMYGEQDLEFINILNAKAAVHYEEKDYETAFDCFNKVLSITLRICGEEHLKTAGAYMNLGSTSEEMEDHKKCIDNINKALNIYLQKLETNHS